MIKTNFKRKFQSSPGQALVEFALIVTVLLMMIFLIIESARILWAWVTVQQAAREGGRYAVTGQYEPDCAVSDLPKFNESEGGRDLCDPNDSAKLRVASIVGKARSSLSGLPVNEQSVTFEDEYYYNIEVWGVNDENQLEYDYAGLPRMPVVVRVTYRVPIITPFFRPILPTIPVFGQVTMNNETFGQLGGVNQGEGLPPNVPPVPTPGVTPSPSPSPTPTSSPTPGNTPTHTPTATSAVCQVQFEGSATVPQDFVFVTGGIGTVVTIDNLTTNQPLGQSAPLEARDGHACPGFATVQLSRPLLPEEAGDVLRATSSDGSIDTTIVLAAPPTATATATSTATSSPTITRTPTATSTATPSSPFIALLPSCRTGPQVQFNILGANWPANDVIRLYWDTEEIAMIPAGQHSGSFQRSVTRDNVANGTYLIRAQSSSGVQATATFSVPCAAVTATPTPTTPPVTPTPAPADLIIVGPPTMVSTPPIMAYKPVQFSMVVSNTGDIDVNSLFFVDLYLDPSVVLTSSIPITQSSGYSAISSLGGGASQIITITSQLGFKNSPVDHLVFGMVDSLQAIPESIETNNISTPFAYNQVTPAFTPTPTATPNPNGTDTLSGVVRRLAGNWVPQFRAQVTLIDESTTRVVATTQSDVNGFYQFTNLPAGTYTLRACLTVDNKPYVGRRTGMTPPNFFADIFMIQGPCS